MAAPTSSGGTGRVRRAVGLVGAATVGYLLGTFPSADLATRLAARRSRRRADDDPTADRPEPGGGADGAPVDLRRAGSGNPGALNAAAQLGTGWGAAVLAADAGKGALAGVTGRALAGDDGAYLAATTAIAGHVAPVWTGFRGGKGVATSAGACLAVFPAYFPLDAAVAALGASATASAERAVQLSCATWVGAAVLWWRRGLPNAWGPRPGPGLPLFAAAGSAMILGRFAAARRRAGPTTTPPAPDPAAATAPEPVPEKGARPCGVPLHSGAVPD